MRRVQLLLGASIFGLIVFMVGINVLNARRFRGAEFDHAARALLERSARLKAIAEPGYQQRALASLGPNPLNGNVIRLDDRVATSRVVGEANRPETLGDGMLYSADFESNGGRLVVPNGRDHVSRLTITPIPVDTIGELIIRARADHDGILGIRWSTQTDVNDPRDFDLEIALPGDGAMRDYIISTRGMFRRDGTDHGEVVREIRFRLHSNLPSTAEIERVGVVSKLAKYRVRGYGTDYESIGGEMRRVLFMATPLELEFELDVADRAMHFEVGLARLSSDSSAQVSVTVSEDDSRTTLMTHSISSSDRWEDLSFDLTAWRGRTIQLSLAASAATDDVVLWSNPVIFGSPRERMNIIVLLEDTTRADHLSEYGYERVTTPNKSRFFDRQGIVFRYAFAQSTKTRSSVPTLMTSLLPSSTGVWHINDSLDERFVTLAEVLRQQGYATASFIQNTNAGPANGLHQGFGQLFDSKSVGGSTTEDILDQDLSAWLESKRDRNFFLYLHVLDPHGPYDAPDPFDRWYRSPSGSTSELVRRDDRLDPAWEARPTIDGRRALYDGEIRHNDELVGAFLTELDDSGLLDDTLIVMVSDHGEFLGESSNFPARISSQPAQWAHAPPGLAPVIRVPLMVSYPRRFSSRVTIDEPVHLGDVMPTILELAQIDPVGVLLQGDSLVKLIDEGGDAFPTRIVISEEPSLMSKVPELGDSRNWVSGSVILGDVHFISSKQFQPKRVPPLLTMRAYHYRDDVREEHPLLSFVPDLVTRYRVADLLTQLQASNIEIWKDWTERGDNETQRIDPEALERLRALGYIE